jgi:lipopolysaccharide export system protein LptC
VVEPAPRTAKKRNAGEWVQQEVEEVFSRIARYTKFVFFGKWALGLVALIILVSLMLWPLLSHEGGGVRISFVSDEGTGEATVNGVSPVMESPRFQGVDSKGQPYLVTATRATQQSPKLVTMENVRAELTLKDQNWLQITSKNGEFHDDKKLLYLLDGVVMQHQEGYVVMTDRAAVDTAQSIAYGDRPIQAQGPIGNLLATGFEIRDNGNYMKFGLSGRVTVLIKKSQKLKGA